MLEAVPNELKQCPQWLVWSNERLPDSNKVSKQPKSPVNGQAISVTRPDQWTSFDVAYNAYMQHGQQQRWGGLGFVLGHRSGIAGVDLDQVFTLSRDVLDARAVAIADRLSSYTEISPSGTGLHVLVKANVAKGMRRDNVELYSEGRYFTVTGVPWGIPRPIRDCQPEIDILVSEIEAYRATLETQPIDWYKASTITNDALMRMAQTAANGDKFNRLFQGHWIGEYPSQSEADQSLINMLAFYTDSPQQVRDLFLMSGLANRDKARRLDYLTYTIKRAFDRKVPLVGIPAMPVNVTVPEALTEVSQPLANAIEPEAAEEQTALKMKPYTCPPGLVGQIASWLFRQSLYPMEELAIAGALGVIAGIVGRQYQLNGQGLNLYLMFLASTGAGKDVLNQGVSRLFQHVVNPNPKATGDDLSKTLGFPAARTFQGPQQLTGKGVLRFFGASDSMSCVSVVPEFSQTMTQMSDPRAHSGLREFQQVLLDFYTKSSDGAEYAGAMNADKQKDIAVLKSPALTIVCEGTPDRFWRAMSDEMVTDGLMSRFIVIEREGYTDVEQPDHYMHLEVPKYLRDNVAMLCEAVLMYRTHGDQRINVRYTDEAAAYSDHLRRYYRGRGISKGTSEVHKVLWLRAHQNLVRIAALLSIGEDMHMPTVTEEHLRWANGIVYRQVTLLIGKFRRGEIGQVDDSEALQQDQVRELIKRWVRLEPHQITGPHKPAWQAARAAGLIPLAYLSFGACKMSVFRNSKLGASEALRRVTQHFERMGALKRVAFEGHNGDFYAINH